VVLICGWVFAAPLQPVGYDPTVQSISSLAAQGAADPWLMTGALAAAGVCHMVTGVGLRSAARAGRIVLFCGGLTAILVALSPESSDGDVPLRHIVSTAIGFTALALFPSLATVKGRPGLTATESRGPANVRVGARRRYMPTNWTLRPVTGYAVTALMAACMAWFLLELHGHGGAGFVERVLTSAQSFWPLIVVVACLLGTRRLRAPAPHLPIAAAGLAHSEKSDFKR
jgi:hypothetical membrane protein